MNKQSIYSLTAFILSFLIYMITLCPTVYVGDAGELISASYLLGIGHPPGYPLYCLLGKLFTIFIPVANIAFRINILSAVFSSCAIFIFYWMILQLFKFFNFSGTSGNLNTTAFITSLFLAFSRTLWAQTIDAEVYTLNAFFVVLILYLLLSYLNSKNHWILYLFSFIFGLGLTNHHTLALLSPVFIAYIIHMLWTRNYEIKTNIKILSLMIMTSLLGLSLYLYLPIRAFTFPIVNWGNPQKLSFITDHLLRKQYGSLSEAPLSIKLLIEQLTAYSQLVYNEFSQYIFLFIPLGIIIAFLQKKTKFLLLVLPSWFFSSIVFILISNFRITPHNISIVEVFFIPSHIFIAILIAAGIFSIFQFAHKFIKSSISRNLISLLVILLCILPLNANMKETNRSSFYLPYDYGVNVLNTPSPNSVLFSAGDSSTFVAMYLQLVEGMRKDLAVLDDTGTVFKNIYGEDFIKMSQQAHDMLLNARQLNIIKGKLPIYLILGSNVHNMSGLNIKPIGLIFKVIKPFENELIEKNPWKRYSLSSLYSKLNLTTYLEKDLKAQHFFSLGEYYFDKGDMVLAKKMYKITAEIGEEVDAIKNSLAATFTRKNLIEDAFVLAKDAVKMYPNNPDVHNALGASYLGMREYEKAISEFTKAIEIQPNFSEAYNNLGVTYLRMGILGKSIEAYQRAISIKPGDVELHKNLGIAYIQANMIKEAEASFRTALNINAGYPELYFQLGNALIRQNRLRETVEEYKKAISLNNKYIEAYNNLGVALDNQGLYDEAIKVYKKALGFAPAYAEAHCNLGGAYFNKGLIKEAVKEWEIALKLDPNQKKAREFLQRIKR